jgi:hypothetical protein
MRPLVEQRFSRSLRPRVPLDESASWSPRAAELGLVREAKPEPLRAWELESELAPGRELPRGQVRGSGPRREGPQEQEPSIPGLAQDWSLAASAREQARDSSAPGRDSSARVPDSSARVPDRQAQAPDRQAAAMATWGRFALQPRPAQQYWQPRSEELSNEFACVGLLEARRTVC